MQAAEARDKSEPGVKQGPKIVPVTAEFRLKSMIKESHRLGETILENKRSAKECKAKLTSDGPGIK